MEDVQVPDPNPFVVQWKKGPICKAMVERAGERAKGFYQQTVHKRTGELAASARVDTFLDSIDQSWVAQMIVGEGTDHGASHEFGTGRTNPRHAEHAAHDLETVLRRLAEL